MVQRIILLLLSLGVVGLAVAWILSAPDPFNAEEIANLPGGQAQAGETVFWAGGCASCHAAPKASGEEKLKLGGGLELKTPFGVFVAPNISPDPSSGLGNWSLADFASAMKRGVRPDGAHYYPAFPYPSYSRMTDQDVSDLWAFINTLPPVSTRAADHRLSFPFNIRRVLGFWKLLYLNDEMVVSVPDDDPVLQRGRYLVEALGHCGECHTPRNPLGGPDNSAWLGGGPSPEGNETIPNISPHEKGIGDWTLQDIAYSLETGFTPEFDSFGSSMADVQLNMARLTTQDRDAIAAYLKQIPAVDTRK